MRKIISLFALFLVVLSACEPRIEMDMAQWGDHAILNNVQLFKYEVDDDPNIYEKYKELDAFGMRRIIVSEPAVIDTANYTVTVRLKGNETITEAGFIFFHESVEIEPLGDAPRGGIIADLSAGEFVYRLTSADGTVRDWTIIVKKPIVVVALDRSTWTIHSFKSETVNATKAWGAAKVIDADVNSLWRSAWPTLPDSDFPQWIIIDMQEEVTMDAIKIKGTADGKGHSKHTWEISSDATSWTALGEFDMNPYDGDHQTNTLEFQVTGRYLRYTATVPGPVKTAQGGTFYCDWVSDIQPVQIID